MDYESIVGDLVAENAQFQTIVKSFALEHLARGALSDDGGECGLGSVRVLQPAPRKK
jgi:hypothetical protein